MLIFDERHPGWTVVFISEVDKSLVSSFESCFVDGHKVFRHWPGAGSFAMAIIINRSFVDTCKTCFWNGRAGGVHLYSFAAVDCTSFRTGLNLIVSGFHGAHGDGLEDSLTDTTIVLQRLRRRIARSARVVVVSDSNVDYLPTFQNDPWSHLHGREFHHSDRRLLYEQWLETMSLQLELPQVMLNVPAVCEDPGILGVPFTRIPIGGQAGFPSLLDHAAASRHLIEHSFADWSAVDADHALVGFVLKSKHFIPQRPRRIWQCFDEDTCVQKLAAQAFTVQDSLEHVV